MNWGGGDGRIPPPGFTREMDKPYELLVLCKLKGRMGESREAGQLPRDSGTFVTNPLPVAPITLPLKDSCTLHLLEDHADGEGSRAQLHGHPSSTHMTTTTAVPVVGEVEERANTCYFTGIGSSRKSSYP